MNCLTCRGACCEYLRLVVGYDTPGVREFARARRLRVVRFPAGADDSSALLVARIDHACPKLDVQGRCSIYETRPEPCRTAAPGGEACLEALRSQRSPSQYLTIREPGDPEVL